MEYTTEEERLTQIMDNWIDEYYWNRIILTGVARSGKTTFLDKYTKHSNIPVVHSPHFVMTPQDSYLFLKYGYILDRWYSWDRFIFPGDDEPIIEDYSHDILAIIFLKSPYVVDDKFVIDKRTEVDIQKSRYLELARRLDESNKRIKVLIYGD